MMLTYLPEAIERDNTRGAAAAGALIDPAFVETQGLKRMDSGHDLSESKGISSETTYTLRDTTSSATLENAAMPLAQRRRAVRSSSRGAWILLS